MTTTDTDTDTVITLSRSRDVPFKQLVLSDRNVRRVQTDLSIEELAEDIAQRTLLQSLSVRPIPNWEGFYEVQAGGRRYRALALLVKKGRLADDAPIPCIVREGGLLEEDSLAENVQRLNLHPLDQFRAFQSMRAQGLGEEEIAARFFVTPLIVKQRLKLASVSPKLLEIYADDEMTLEQLMAFTVTDDHARQEQVWEAVSQGYNSHARTIRRLLTENSIEADDPRVRFVGLAAYEAAGGKVRRDLFSEEDEGWIEDAALLERLFTERLTREADAVRAEGWKWVEAAENFPYGHKQDMRRVEGEDVPMTEEEESRHAALTAEMAQIETNNADGNDLPEDVERRAVEIEETLIELEDRPLRYDPADIARAGAFVSVDDESNLVIERGYIRGEDDVRVTEDGEIIDEDSPSNNTPPPPQTDDEDEGVKPLSDRLMMELTAHRTLALRDALAQDEETAFLAALHVLCLQTFYRYAPESCLEITLKTPYFSVQGQDLKTCASAKAIDARHAAWEKQLPEDKEDLWNVLQTFDEKTRRTLFAHCVSLSVNAVRETGNFAAGRKRYADQLAEALALDMTAAGWTPTAANYLGRVSKARILEAVTEAKGAAEANLIAHLKKSDMAEQAERMLEGTSWLPEPLRTRGVETLVSVEAQPETSVEEVEDSDLPAFLTEAA